jgi:tRNA A-37 threonylcarbamoyl transferase component Bud32
MIELKEGTPVGEYEIQEQIGEGAMGTVFSAIHPLIGKTVAVKVLKSELCANQATIDRFVQEAQAVNKIGHPNIVDVFSLGELADGRAYMVMEWLRGEDLKTRLARGPLGVPEAGEILDGIARALEAAHAKDIVHRDLKPDNVFLHQVDDGPPMVKLLDFGIAKLVRHTPGGEKTQTGNMLGTPRYISPEQARGVQVDHRSDIYSLGVMAFEMLAGRPPFQGETAMDLVMKHLSEPPPDLGQHVKLPRPLEQCVMRMLEKDPARRPTLDEIRGILSDPSRRLTPLPSRLRSGVSPVPSLPSRPPKALVIALGLAGAIGLGVLTWRLVGGRASTGAEAAEVAVNEPGAELAGVTPTQQDTDPAEPRDTPAPAAPGTLEVNVSGATDATIFVDGKEWARGAVLKVELEPGSHEVMVRPAKGAPIKQTVEVGAGQVNTITIVVPRTATGTRSKKPIKSTKATKPTKPGDDDLLVPKGKTRR